MKRFAWGAVVTALLAIGVGALASVGTPHGAGAMANVDGPHTTGRAATTAPSVVHHLAPAVHAAQTTPVRGTTTLTSTPSRQRVVTTATVAVATRHTAGRRGHTGAHQATGAPVTLVDPATVSLPPAGPVLLLNPNTAAPGATIAVLGSGFDPGKLVTLRLVSGGSAPRSAAQSVVVTAQAGRDGSFGKSITLPAAVNARTFWVSAQERSGPAHAMAGGTLASGSPTATLSTAVGKPGDTVYASARGFDAGEAVDVFLNNLGTAPVTTLLADGGGGLSLAPVPVPYGPVGPTALLLLGRHSRGLAAIPFEMLGLYPTAAVSSYAAVADTVLSFSASGFGPDEAIDVRVNTPDGYAVGQLHSDSAGAVRNAGHFRIPFSLKGRNIFVLTGEESHTSTTVAFTVQPYQPIAAPSSYGGGPGTAITFYGTGFARHETVRLWVSQAGGGRSALRQTMQTDGLGNLIARPGLYLVGTDAQPGKLVFTLAGDKSETPVAVAFSVQSAANQGGLGTSSSGG